MARESALAASDLADARSGPHGVSGPSALVLASRLPWPLDDGGHLATWQTLWSIAQEFDTTLVAMVPPSALATPVPEAFAKLGVEVVRVAHRPPPMALALVRGAFGRWPYMLARYRNPAFDATVRRLVAERPRELVLVNSLHLTTYLDALGDVPVVLRTQNLEHLWLERFAGRLTNPVARLYVRDQVRRMRRTEAERCARCDLVLAIREGEAEVLRTLAPATRVETLPIALDMDRYLPHAPERPPIVALIASWEWAPNADGGRDFLVRGWPRVRERMPEARLRLVGKNIPADFAKRARQAGAEVIGYVDDMAVEFARAAVLVVPLWMGSGIRVKIVEALAAGVPVVTTSIGAEGLELKEGVHAAFAETPESLGDAVVESLRDPDRAQAMADAGSAWVRARHSLAAVTARTLQLCAEAAASHAERRR